METKSLRPRASVKKDLDVIILVDGSDTLINADFNREKQLCLELAARLAGNSQLGVIQFGSKSQIVAPLGINRDELEKKVDSMAKISGSAHLGIAFEICNQEFAKSKFPNNAKQIWIFTNGNFKQDPRNATLTEKLIRDKQVTVIAVGVGFRVTMRMLHRVASSGCCFLVGDFSKALRLFQYKRNCQIAAEIVFSKAVPFKLGENIVLKIEIENAGRKDIAQDIQGERIFQGKNSGFIRNIEDFYVKLKVKETAAASSIDTHLTALPEILEFVVLDTSNSDIPCDTTGFFLNFEDFSGDIVEHKTTPDVPVVNIMTFGPPGLGKSSFVNSVCSALSDHIPLHFLSVVASTKAIGKALQQFPLHQMHGLGQTPINFYDVFGLEAANFSDEEIDRLLSGIGNETNTSVAYQTTRGVKYSPQQALAMKMHVVAFFVPPTSDENTLNVLVPFYQKIIAGKRCKVVIAIAQADTVLETDRRTEIHNAICQKFSIATSNVFFVENYVDTKDKQFNTDKNVIRVVFALLNNAQELITSQRSDATETEETEPTKSPRATIIDLEEVARNEKEALLIENNEMHVHISNLQNQVNNLQSQLMAVSKQKGVAVEPHSSPPASPRAESPRGASLVSIFASFFGITGGRQEPPVAELPSNETDSVPSMHSTEASSNSTTGPKPRTNSRAKTPEAPPINPPPPTTAKYGAAKPSAPKYTSGTLFSLVNPFASLNPKMEGKRNFTVKKKAETPQASNPSADDIDATTAPHENAQPSATTTTSTTVTTSPQEVQVPAQATQQVPDTTQETTPQTSSA